MSDKQLLVVDDDPNVITFMDVVLRTRGYRVFGMGSAEDALERLSGVSPVACFLDVRLPGMNGLDAFRAFRGAGLDVPVILVTSHASMEIAIAAMKEGAYDFLTKPLKADAVLRLIDQLERAERDEGEEVDLAAVAQEERGVQIIGKSPAMVEVFKTIGRVAQTDATVLITGESGSGKELVARVLHQNSRRSRAAFVALNCAAIPEALLESELFGHEKGAFTGALHRKIGTFERASRGTLFLDEIGDMSLVLQAKILRALQEKKIERVGGTERIPVDVRVLAATNHDLEAEVAAGTFREDLYYRLTVVTVGLPPLRERQDDIRRLIDDFVTHFSQNQHGKDSEVQR